MTNMEEKNVKRTPAALRGAHGVIPRDLVSRTGGDRSWGGQAGMTMLEILIVLAILALVMGFLLGPRIMEWFGQSKKTLAGPMVDEYASKAYPLWSRDNMGKQCPDTIDELAKYTNKEDAKDPWGNELVMVCGESAPEGVPNRFGVISKGEDGKLDTEDDVKSWDRKNR